MNHRTMIATTMRTVALLCCACLAGCGPQFLTYNSISFLQKGMDQSSVHMKLDVSSTNTTTIVDKGQTYVLEYYSLQTAQQLSSSATRPTLNYTSTLILLYKDRQLRYWGMMGDYSKSEDPEIFAMAPAIYPQFRKQ